MKNILIVGSSGTGKSSYIADLVKELSRTGERFFLLDSKGTLRKKLETDAVDLLESPSSESILVADDASYFDFETFPYKRLILCTSDRVKYEELLHLAKLADEFHLFSFQPENGFKASDILGDHSFKSFRLSKYESFVIKKEKNE